MIALAVLVFVVVGAASLAVGMSRRGGRPTAQLSRWADAGLISPMQVEAIRRFEASHAAPASSVTAPVTAAPVVSERPAEPVPETVVASPVPRSWRLAEAIGYLGGVLASVGVALLAARYWPDLGAGARVSITATGAAVVLLGAGLVDEELSAAFRRLRWFLWLLATALLGTTGGIVMHDVVGTRHAPSIVVAIAATVSVVSLALWRDRERPLQEVTALVATPIALGVALGDHVSAASAGLVVLVLGVAVTVGALRHVILVPAPAVFVGSVTATTGAIVVGSRYQGLGGLLALAWAGVLLGLVLLRSSPVRPVLERRLLAAAAGWTLLQATAPTIVYYADRASVVTGLAVSTVGLATIALGITDRVVARRFVVAAGGVPLLGGAAIVGSAHGAVGPLLGIALALGIVAGGLRWPHLPFTMMGSLGLLVFVPWTIGHFFPGQGRAAMVTLVAGATLLAVSLLLVHDTRHRHIV